MFVFCVVLDNQNPGSTSFAVEVVNASQKQKFIRRIPFDIIGSVVKS